MAHACACGHPAQANLIMPHQLWPWLMLVLVVNLPKPTLRALVHATLGSTDVAGAPDDLHSISTCKPHSQTDHHFLWAPQMPCRASFWWPALHHPLAGAGDPNAEPGGAHQSLWVATPKRDESNLLNNTCSGLPGPCAMVPGALNACSGLSRDRGVPTLLE